MRYLISILLIIIVIFFAFLKPKYNIELFDSSDNSDILDLYVITLGKEERIANVKKQETKIGKKINIYNGVIGLKLDMNDLIKKGILSENHNLSKNINHAKRETGCYLSHLNIYKKIKKDNKKGYTIIFEDDFLVDSENLLGEVKKAIDTLNTKNIDFDFLFLGNTKNNYGENIIDNLYQVNPRKRLWGLYGYLINNKNIDKIIDKTNKIDRPIDVIIEYLSYNNDFNTIIMYPNIIKHQSNYKSTVDNTEDVL
jgi:GR25 family glycosyltransferase involved in LPS biosynthesis